MPHKAKPKHYDDVKRVTTASEAARLYGVSWTTVIYAIDTGNLAAEKVGGTWLISLASLRDYWGEPRKLA